MSAAGALILALAVAGCGSSPSSEDESGRKTRQELKDAAEAVDGLGAEEREAKLRELAKKEGSKLVLYTTLNPRLTDPLAEKFEADYGIEVKVYETSSSNIVQRVQQETRAGRSAADVIDTGGPEQFQLAKDGTFADFESPYHDGLVEGAKRDGWTTNRFTTFVAAWNRKLVKRGEEPRTWEELAQPKWKGKLAISPESPGVSWFKTLRDHWVKEGKSEEEADRLFRGIAANARAIGGGGSAISELLVAGDYEVAAGSASTSDIDGLEADDAPVAWKPPVEPVIRLPAGIGLVRDAPHPAAAMLFIDFAISEGQDIFEADHRSPARKDLANRIDAEGIVVDLESLSDEQEEWNERWDRIAGRAGKGGS